MPSRNARYSRRETGMRAARRVSKKGRNMGVL
jgi:hypothetical protein